MSGSQEKRSAQAELQAPAPGPGGLAREQVSEIQRARIVYAMVEVAAERGVANATVARVVARSGVSRRTFYELFEDREDCFLAAFDDAVDRIAAVVVPAYEQPSKWRERIRAGLTALLQALDYDPGMERLVVVESLGAGARALERRSRVLAQLIAAIDEGRLEARRSGGPPPLTAEGLAGAVLSVVHARMLADDRRPLVELAGPLMSMIVLPYLGPAASARELARPVPAKRTIAVRSFADPFAQLGMRVTYRTIRVLMAVAGSPGSSNRALADMAGIADQGQISKLLARLERLGLLRNDGPDGFAGMPKAWTLTARGEQLARAVREHVGASGGSAAGARPRGGRARN